MLHIQILQGGTWQRHELSSRFTIGQRSDCSLVISASRFPPLAAVIRRNTAGYSIQNVGPETLLQVNGTPLDSVRSLAEGDEITVAGCRLVLAQDAERPSPPRRPTLRPVMAPPAHPAAASPTATPGLQVRCECGAKLQIPTHHQGRRGRCPQCSRCVETGVASPAVAPDGSPVTKPAGRPRTLQNLSPAATPPGLRSSAMTCSICHSELTAEDEQVRCSGCQLPYHHDCWQANLGCSAYGCSQVNILNERPEISVPAPLPHFSRLGTAGTNPSHAPPTLPSVSDWPAEYRS